MSVDTYLKGKDTSSYRRVHHEDITLLIAKPLLQYASRIELVTRRKVLGTKLTAIAHHQHTAACRH
ncbi:MAG: hypothetical protein ACRBK7_13490 [Acidimicrobiales bacterium]